MSGLLSDVSPRNQRALGAYAARVNISPEDRENIGDNMRCRQTSLLILNLRLLMINEDIRQSHWSELQSAV